jgi:hypothetical protein
MILGLDNALTGNVPILSPVQSPVPTNNASALVQPSFDEET